MSTSALPSRTASGGRVPIVASGDAPAPDTYTTEALIENPFARPARIGFELFPSRRRAEITLAAGENRTWNDLVYQLFGSLDVGWLRVQSDAPVRCGF